MVGAAKQRERNCDAQRLGSHIGMDLTMGWSRASRWKIELFGVVVTLLVVTVVVMMVFPLGPFALDTLLLVVLAVTIVIGLQAVGVVLMVAFLVTPAATAYLLTDRLPWMMAVSTAVALVSDAKDLYAGRYQPNQRTVPEEGPNHFQPSPVLASALRQPDGRIIVTGRASGAGTLQVYKPEPGKLTPVADVPTDAANFTATIPADKSAGLTQLTATVTVGGETSEFGNTIQVRDDDPPPVDTEKPTVTVSAPAAGLTVESREGASVNVAWTARDNVGVASQSIQLTGKRAGQTFTESVAAGLPGAASSFTLTIRRDEPIRRG